ncbi:MAG: MBL fold metallo-hydrolase [Erysipelotrichaceae bacterium]
MSDIRTKYVVADCGKKAIIYKTDNLYIGDKIEIQGEFQSINQNGNFFGYSFSRSMRRNNIYFQITPTKIKVVSRSNTLGHKIYGRINRMENVEQRDIIKSYLYGFSNEDENLNTYVRSSGMHVSTLISWLYGLLLFVPTNYVTLILCLFVLFIGNITRFSFSLKRIFIFTAIKFILPREDAKTRLGISIILILLICPNAIYELGFIIPVCFSLFGMFTKYKKRSFIKSMLVLLPIQLCTFYRTSILSIITFNIQRTLFAFNYLLSLLCIVFPLLGGSLLILNKSFCEFVNSLNLINIVGRMNILFLFIYLILLFKYMNRYDKKDLVKIYCLVALIPYGCFFIPYTQIYFNDVGQGDCILIIEPFNMHTIMIDIAGNLKVNIPKTKLEPTLNALGINRIDTLFITHNDYDHSGGLKELEEIVEVKKVVKNKAEVGRYRLGNIELHSLLNTIDFGNPNDNSIILYTKINGVSYLFTGDISIAVEKRLMKEYPNLRVDVLKAAHHGSKTASSKSFLTMIDPKIAFISAGANNIYHHPSKEVIDNMKNQHVSYFVSANTGALSIISLPYINIFYNVKYNVGIIK